MNTHTHTHTHTHLQVCPVLELVVGHVVGLRAGELYALKLVRSHTDLTQVEGERGLHQEQAVVDLLAHVLEVLLPHTLCALRGWWVSVGPLFLAYMSSSSTLHSQLLTSEYSTRSTSF